MVSPSIGPFTIDRHRAALVRTDLSRPVRLALEANLFHPEITFFDYGCGYGGDIHRMAHRGFTCSGWDPYYHPETPCTPADIVNLGYVINVIENQSERREALLCAWDLAQKMLIVAAQVLIADQSARPIAYGDGIVTSRNTFQKYYDQQELKNYIDQVLGVDAVPVALGIYFVFRDETQAQIFKARRFHSRLNTPRIRIPVKTFEDYQELLTPLMEFVTERGRLPLKGELPAQEPILKEFSTLIRAFQLIQQATNKQEWEAITETRRQDLLVYLALSQFGHRPKLRDLTSEVQNDLKALLGNYKQACEQADALLFSLGQPGIVAGCCKKSPIGKHLPTALYIHVSALEDLDPLLRLYEGCASRTIGRMDGATLIKFHTDQPKISYLFYPDFDTEPHPALQTSMQLDLRDLKVSYRDYDNRDNPPILHRKETFITPNYPNYDKFARLTRQEEAWGLLDETRTIGTRDGWERCLEGHCAQLQGHRIIWRKDADPYKVKLLRSQQRSRPRKGGNEPK
ncbi:DNA phosphorothioation-associated putative methyltransferase [Anthocerotibacter panamensis]|uniref:DNA phosphorothioation-associated putative methyltransferase n=1 Tax=Anthocerotibacter panamensis TaxID=2857077 RepID=UPI001C403F09|nr:DNA phosphorothioation-associated putative methyltransferase [Anthocerotibacter panamensis]